MCDRGGEKEERRERVIGVERRKRGEGEAWSVIYAENTFMPVTKVGGWRW